MLFDELCSTEHLYLAWRNLNRTNTHSFGISGESIGKYAENLDSNISLLSEEIKNKTFRFAPGRPKLIPKDNGKFRPLVIPEVRDRIVLKGIALILERELKQMMDGSEGVSFAYQKGLGIQDALFKIKEYYLQGAVFIYEADIIDFFGTVNRRSLMDKICNKLSDQSLNDLIKAGIVPRIGNLESIPENERSLFSDKGGIPQGNALSPLFSNIFLAPFDEEMKKKGFKLIRYADDFIVMCESQTSAQSAYDVSSSYLVNQLGLAVHELSDDVKSKTRIVNPLTDDFSFLSVSFDGKNLFPSVKNKTRFLGNIADLCNQPDAKLNVLKLLNKVKNSHEGWISTFIFTDVARYFEEIDFTINEQLYKYLKRCGWNFQKKSLGKIPHRLRKKSGKRFESGECLSVEQRLNSGVLPSQQIFNMRKSANIRKAANMKARQPKHKKSTLP